MEDISQTQLKRFLIIRNTITVVTVISYIAFSMVKRIWENQNLYWIPFIIVCANLMILFENTFTYLRNRNLHTKSNSFWLFNQFVINVALGILIYSYLK
jgi:hypothetical protein